ncbi:antibiotic biosynthesis monooxygenase [Klebsiella pneumoniae subsp. pneumoniae]|uniref:putative quinol monooxygenase n=1 Tax=Klebsiella pneumoniae TaxID=573 RepID=UPI0021B3AD20|nr:putative quinol monooxygenase [Klebsiella pneumoniae]MCT6795045.1 antibiotic biosynthesis monooxygenase [Klebsiella pneumoniae subsp. pneumoniae]
MNINIVVFIYPEESFFDEMIFLFKKLKHQTDKEDGCLQFDVYLHEEKFILIEKWENQQSIDTHMSKDYTQNFIGDTKPHIIKTEVYRLKGL